MIMGKIPAEYLPAKELWPQRIYSLPEHKGYPQKLNSTEELIDRHVEAGSGDRVAILFEDQKITYKALQATVNKLGSAPKGPGIAAAGRALLRAPPPPPALVPRDRMAIWVLLYPSGTPGLPKGTVHFMEEALIVPDGFGKHGWRVTETDVIGGPPPPPPGAGHRHPAR